MKKNVHICFVNPYVGLLTDWGPGVAAGAETQILSFAKALVQNGADVSIATQLAKNKAFINKDRIKWYSTPFRYLGGSNLYLLPDWIRLAIVIKKINPDIVLLKYPRHLIFLLGYLGQVLKFKTFFFAAIDKDAQVDLTKNEPAISRIFYRLGMKQTTGVIAQTQQQKAALQTMTQKAVYALPSIFSPEPESNQTDKAVPEGKNFILWVGSNSKRKRPKIFIDLAHRFPEMKFVMIFGRGDGSGRITDYKKPANLEYVVACPKERMPYYYQNALFLLSTSALEGFPNVFLESWWYKKPVLSLELDPDGIIEKHALGKVVKNQKKLEKELNSLVFDEHLRRSLGDNGHRYVKQHHASSKVVNQLLQYVTR